MKRLVVIADWAADPLYAGEFTTLLNGFYPDALTLNPNYIPCQQNTYHAGFMALQQVLFIEHYGRPRDTVIYVNSDPHIDKKTRDYHHQPSPLSIFLLKNGLYLVGSNSGYTFSLLRDHIHYMFVLGMDVHDRMFHNRERHAYVTSLLIQGLQDDLDLDQAHTSSISGITGDRIGHIDSFGSLLTTISSDHLKEKYDYGSGLYIEINGVKRLLTFRKRLFDGHPGDLMIYETNGLPYTNPMMSIGFWEDPKQIPLKNAAGEFNDPEPGDEIVVL